MAAGHFAGHFSAIFGSGPVSHSVAGQPSRKAWAIVVMSCQEGLGAFSVRNSVLTFEQGKGSLKIRNGRSTVSRVLFQKRQLTAFCGKLGEFGEKLGEFAWHINNRLRGTH